MVSHNFTNEIHRLIASIFDIMPSMTLVSLPETGKLLTLLVTVKQVIMDHTLSFVVLID